MTSDQRAAAEAEADAFVSGMTQTAEAILAVADAVDEERAPTVPAVGIVEGLAEHHYHADPCEEPSLSSSVATTLVHRSPLHAYHRHPRLGGASRASSDAQTEGKILHALLLEQTDADELVRLAIGERFEVVPFPDFRKKAARERKARLELAGVKAITRRQYDEHLAAARALEDAANAIRRRLIDGWSIELGSSGLDEDTGHRRFCELSIFWRPTTTDGEEIQARARLDQLDIFPESGLAVITDLKKARSAHPQRAERSIESYGYDIQRAAYISAVEAVFPELVGRVQYRWVFVEAEAPYAPTPGEATGELRELGEMRWQRAVDTWARCMRDDHWPAYVAPGVTARLSALPWAVAREMGGEE